MKISCRAHAYFVMLVLYARGMEGEGNLSCRYCLLLCNSEKGRETERELEGKGIERKAMEGEKRRTCRRRSPPCRPRKQPIGVTDITPMSHKLFYFVLQIL